MRAIFTFRVLLVGAVVAAAGAASAMAQAQTLQQVRDLYAQAAYEDALGMLARLPSTEPSTEAARYRAACQLALGRADEARRTVAEIVEAYPEYLPDSEETSPRVMELFHAARRQKLPGVVRATYTDAKAAMDRQEPDLAIVKFETLIRLASDPDMAADSTVSELKVLATGFLELTRARAAASKPKEAANPEAVPAPPSQPAAPPVVTPAVPINQQLPPWTPPDGLSRRQFTGAVRVQIGADGKVTSATMDKPVHPAYDARLLAAAKGWTYHPARQNGAPVASVRIVEVMLKPQ